MKLSDYGVFSGLHFPVLSANMGKYRLEKTQHSDVFSRSDNYSEVLRNNLIYVF